MGKYNHSDIDNILKVALENERHYNEVSNDKEYGEQDYYFFHGKAEAYHDMVHYLVELKKNM